MFAVQSLRELRAASSAGVITTNSSGAGRRYEVVAKFKTLEEMQAFLDAIAKCSRAVRELGEPDEQSSDTDTDTGSVGPFSHGTGGGKRNIRGTNSLT